MEDLTGKKFGSCEVVSLIGEGGMAAVFKAYQPAMDRYVALKVLPSTLALDKEFVARFEREAKILAQLQHPHILPVFDYGNENGHPYLIMPLLSGGTLASTFNNAPQPFTLIRQRIAQVGDALDYAHGHGMVHRDIKPSNILLDERNNCLLCDFGLAKILEAANKITASGGVVGTPHYMSPEQASGAAIDHRTDIYSLGVVLFEMATGRIPFSADTPIAVAIKHIQEPLPMPRALNPDIPYALELVICKALQKNPAERYATAADMVKELQRAIPEKTLIVPEVEIRSELPTILQPPAAPTLAPVEPAPAPPTRVAQSSVKPDAPVPVPVAASSPAPEAAKVKPRGGNAALSEVAVTVLSALGWGVGGYLGLQFVSPGAWEDSFTALALMGGLGGGLLGFGMTLRSYPIRWWWMLALAVTWMTIGALAFNAWAGLGALALASIITCAIAKSFEPGLDRDYYPEIISSWILAGVAAWCIYLIFNEYGEVAFAATHAGWLGALVGGFGGYHTSVTMRNARLQREARRTRAAQRPGGTSMWERTYRAVLLVLILAVGYRAFRVIMPEAECQTGLTLWTTSNLVEWRAQAGEFQMQAGETSKIVAVVQNRNFIRTSCGTGLGFPLHLTVTPVNGGTILMDIPCPVYADHASCPLYDPASTENEYRFTEGSYTARLMYGDMSAPVAVYPFRVTR